MKNKIFNFILYSLLGALSFSALQVYATTQGGLVPWQGGTGIVGVTAGEVGNCLKVLANSPFRFELGSCGSGSGVWPFITTANNFNLATQSTSTPLWLRGSPFSLFASSTAVFVNASTTQLTVGSDFITDLSTGLSISASGAVTVTDVTCTDCLTSTEIDSSVALSSLTLTVAGTANQITSSAGAQDLTANRTWTLSLPSHVIFPSSYVASQGTTTNATSTNITVTGNFIVEPLTSALVLTGSAGAFAEYAGASCTNQFPQVQSATGGWTCDSVVLTTDVSGDLPFANLAQVSANSVLANPTGATADAQSVATSTLFGASVPGGYVLASNGSTWQAMATATCAAITGSADLCDGSDASGSGGSGTVSTSTNETAGRLPYWTTTSGTPAKLGEVATTSLTASGVITLSQPISVIGAAASALTVTGGTNGQVLGWSAGIPTWLATTTLANISGTLGIGNGGTNATSFTTTGNGVYYNGTSLLTAPLTSAVTYPYASTTAITVSGTASTTQLTVSSAGGTAGCATFSTNGTISNTGTACGTGAGGGDDPFSHTTNFGQTVSATTTALWMQGSPFSFFASSTAVFVNASTTKLTLGSDFITDLSTGLTIDAAGAVTVTDVTCTNCIGATEINDLDIASGGTNASSFTTSGNGVYYNGSALVTAPLTSAVTYPYASTTMITATTASTTNLTVSGLTSAIALTGVQGTFSEYAGSGTCTNQAVTTLSALGAATCASINNDWWSGTDLSVANGGTGLSTFGGTNHILYTTAADALSSEAAFTYAPSTNLLTVTYASTTALSSSGSAWFATGGGNANVGIGTSTPQWGLQIASSTPYISITDTDAGTNAKHGLLSYIDGIFRIGTSSDTVYSSTSTALSIDPSKPASISIGSTTPTVSAVNGLFVQGSNGENGTSTISTGRLQFDTYNAAGTRSCAFIVGTAWVVSAGACNP